MNRTAIEWSELTWNPVFGCTKVSPGCQKCYAERIARRIGKDFSKVEIKPHKLEEPLRIKQPKMIFVNSMSDLFHEEIPDEFIGQVFDVMHKADWHTYQILTKRPGRMAAWIDENLDNGVLDHIWLGTSVEMSMYMHRLEPLLSIEDCKVHFISFEPLLASCVTRFDGQEVLDLTDIEWVITGGESDYSSPRRANPDWFREIRDEALAEKIPYFHKQNGGTTKCSCHGAWGCRVLDGKIWNQVPLK